MADEMKFEIKITAIGEVRDKDGNLIETVPIESTKVVTQEELDEMYSAQQHQQE